MGLGLQSLDTLSVISADTAKLPAGAVAHFELQELNLASTLVGHIALEALASCHSLKSLGLKSSGLMTNLPPGFLEAMPSLQKLNLSRNQLQVPCWAQTTQGLCQDCGPWICPTMDCTPCPQSPSHAAPAVGAATSGKPADLSAGPGIPGLKEAGEVGLGQESTGRPGQGLGGSAACSSHPKPAGYLHGAELSLGLPGRLHTLNLHLPSGPSGVVLSLSMSLTSLEFHAVSGRKPGMLASNVFPVLQTLTLKGWGLQLGTWNVTKIFPALCQLSLLGDSLLAGPLLPGHLQPFPLAALQALVSEGKGGRAQPQTLLHHGAVQPMGAEAAGTSIPRPALLSAA